MLNVELSLSVPPLCPTDHIPRYASALDVPIDVRHRALELARTAVAEGLANGVAPNGMAGGCLYVAAQELGYSVTQSEVASVVDVSETTIRARKEELLQAS